MVAMRELTVVSLAAATILIKSNTNDDHKSLSGPTKNDMKAELSHDQRINEVLLVLTKTVLSIN